MDNSKYISKLKYLVPCIVLLVSLGYQVLYVNKTKFSNISTEKLIQKWNSLISEEPNKYHFSRIAVG